MITVKFSINIRGHVPEYLINSHSDRILAKIQEELKRIDPHRLGGVHIEWSITEAPPVPEVDGDDDVPF